MLFSVEWLGQYVDLRDFWPGDGAAGAARVGELAAVLTNVGLTVDDASRLHEGAAGPLPLLDVDVGSNRPDCMNHLGVAREAAVALGRELVPPPAEPRQGGAAIGAAARVAVEDAEGCPRYVARVVRGVRVGPSPEWLRERLRAIGVRPIDNVVDVTNYVLWELGQPLHAFDLRRLAGGAIVVRRARPGERLTTLDGEERRLDPEVLVIADAERAVALAGVMGGRDSEVTGATTEVLIESAHFDRRRVRRGARAFGLHTDASHRFERGADPEACGRAADRAAALVAELAGGEVAPGTIDVRAPLPEGWPPRGRLERDRLRRFAGGEIGADEIERILRGLGFAAERAAADAWRVTVPSWRFFDFALKPRPLWSAEGDNVEEQDLFEEVMRHVGFERFPPSLPTVPGRDAGEDGAHALRTRVQTHLAACGYVEAIDYAFQPEADDAATPALRRSGPPVRLQSPPSAEYAVLRRSLLPGLSASARFNLRRGAAGVRLFEVGVVFPGAAEPERELVALVAGGASGTPWDRHPEADLFALKGAVESLGAALGVEVAAEPAAIAGFVDGTAARLAVAGRPAGHCGQLEGADGPVPLYAAELELDALAGGDRAVAVQLPSRFPGVAMDLTLTHAVETPWSAIAAAIRERRPPDLVDWALQVRYQGPGVPPGAVNTTIRFLYNAADRSLTQEEVNARHRELASELERRFGRRNDR